jgi:predicted GNAT family acetyltransferase
VPLANEDLPELERFYAASYPNGGFTAAALQPGRYAGLRLDGVLVGVAGVHAWSAAYRVAALGNVATHPAFRGRGVAARVTASLCRWLLDTVDHIGLVVMADNHAAIRSYEKIGFSHHSDVEACSLEAR